MFILHVTKNNIDIRRLETLTSGAVGVFRVQFYFNADWNDLEKTVAFTDGIGEPVCTRVDELGICTIPWEVLRNVNRELKVGVQGTKDGTIILPTVWASLGKIKQGVTLGDSTQEPTPEIYNQVLEAVREALNKSQEAIDKSDEVMDLSQEILDNLPVPMTAEELREILTNTDIEQQL